MKIIDCTHGDEIWSDSRVGKITASEMSRLIDSDGSPARLSTVRGYAEELAGEEIIGKPIVEWGSKDAERGHVLEPVVVREYERLRALETEAVGFVLSDDETYGASPDRLVIGRPGCFEAKTAKIAKHIHLVLDRRRIGSPPPEHMAQCWGEALVTEREWTDLMLGAWNARFRSKIWRIYLTDSVRRVLEAQIRLCLELKAEALEHLLAEETWRFDDVFVEAPDPEQSKKTKQAKQRKVA